MPPIFKEQPMRIAVMTCLVAASAVVGGNAAAETACEAKCQANSACLKRCAETPKRRSHLRPRPMAPSLSHDTDDRSNDWRERAFRVDGGGGGGGGSGGGVEGGAELDLVRTPPRAVGVRA